MADVRHSALAAADLAEILADLEETNPAAASRYADLFAEKAAMLSRFPEIGRPRPEVGPDVRSTLVKPYVLFHRYRDGSLQILRIVHGRRDLRRILEEDAEDEDSDASSFGS